MTLLVVWFRRTATFCGSPSAMPTRVNGQGSGGGGEGGGGASAAAIGGAGGAGGRRDGEKIGRSFVAVSELNGTPQSGLAPGSLSRKGEACAVESCDSAAGGACAMAPVNEKPAIAAITQIYRLIICSPAIVLRHRFAPGASAPPPLLTWHSIEAFVLRADQ